MRPSPYPELQASRQRAAQKRRNPRSLQPRPHPHPHPLTLTLALTLTLTRTRALSEKPLAHRPPAAIESFIFFFRFFYPEMLASLQLLCLTLSTWRGPNCQSEAR